MTFQPWQVFIWRNSGDATSPRFHKPTHKRENKDNQAHWLKYKKYYKTNKQKSSFWNKSYQKKVWKFFFRSGFTVASKSVQHGLTQSKFNVSPWNVLPFYNPQFSFLLHIYVHINVFLCSLCENKHDDEGVHKRPLITFCLIFIVLNHFCSCFSTRLTSYRSCHQRVRLPRGTTDKTTKIRARL